MTFEQLKAKTIITSNRWTEPVRVFFADNTVNGYVRIIGEQIHSGRAVNDLIPVEELASLKEMSVGSDFGAPPDEVFFALETRRYRLASQFDPLLAMSVSKVHPLPHQIEAVYGYVLKLPRIRFLIADDPGAGKTIMAGLVIKELKLRGLASRILIVAPGHLIPQWQRELAERFKEHFEVVNRQVVDLYYGGNVWLDKSHILASMDFMKQEDILNMLSAAAFDLVIVDEAHKMSAYRYGERIERTQRYRLGEKLSEIATHLLFLTATPHRGDPENFRLFLDLLEPGFFATEDLLRQSIEARDNPLFIRRLKEDLKDFEGKPLFLPRHVQTFKFNLGKDSPEEKALYNNLSRYVQNLYNRAQSTPDSRRRRNITFALVVLQRRMASSTYALMRSLERRKDRLEKLLKKAKETPIPTMSLEEAEDLPDEEREEVEQAWEAVSIAQSASELREEIQQLESLIDQARELVDREQDLKFRKLQEALAELQQAHPDSKVLIFTESRDTLVYLTDRLEKLGYSIVNIHGGMKMEERVLAEKTFKQTAQLMVATEAAGEGINLQFCHLMINYDLPWNPNRLEQRMGRIHRYGQTKEVFIYNMVAEDTREGQVMARLFDKLEAIRQAVGSDRVFDVLGEIELGDRFYRALIDAVVSARSIHEILEELPIEVDEAYIQQVREQLGESLATRYIDFTRIRETADRAREQRLIPEYTENFFLELWNKLEGRFRKRGKYLLSIDSIPSDIWHIANDEAFRRTHGPILSSYPRTTFDQDTAFTHPETEFISFGHPLFEAALQFIEQTYRDAPMRGATFEDPDGRLNGVIFFYELNIHDGQDLPAGKRLISVYVSQDGSRVQEISPAIIWDLKRVSHPVQAPRELDFYEGVAQTTIVEAANVYHQKLKAERQRQVEIKKKYGEQSLQHLILRLDTEITEMLLKLQSESLSQEQRGGYQTQINQKSKRKHWYEKALKNLQEALNRELQLTLKSPTLVGVLRVVPSTQTQVSDPEIERIGMEITMRYERAHGRTPEDVAHMNLGYDIRSERRDDKGNPLERRYIEVKARAGIGEVLLTRNEWFVAKQLGDEYYLYVVFHAATDHPELHIVQNPAERVQPEEIIVARYAIRPNDILQRKTE